MKRGLLLSVLIKRKIYSLNGYIRRSVLKLEMNNIKLGSLQKAIGKLKVPNLMNSMDQLVSIQQYIPHYPSSQQKILSFANLALKQHS